MLNFKRKTMVRKAFFLSFVLILTSISFSSCIINDNIKDTSVFIDPGNDPNFKIVVNTDVGFEVFNRKMTVFEIPIYAFSAVEDTKLLHAANILAQYLDNNEDGIVDNITTHNSMKSNKAFLFLWKTATERDSFTPPSGYLGQDLGADETTPIWHTNGHTGNFDASLEEIWHLITNSGYEKAYPTIFSAQTNSEITIAMDVARGGHFENPPATYPTSAWYTYADVTCDYGCQVSEYLYWIMTSMLGAQENRLTEISNEWTLNTSAKVQSGDVKAWTIFTNTIYKFPTVLPDGTYKH